MTASAPAIRTHFVRLALKRLRAIPDGKGAVIRSRIEDALPQIREADPAGWLALDLALTVCNTIVDVLGEEAARQFWTQLIFDSYDRGILKPLISQAREAPRTGGGPIALLKLAPMAWQLAARDCGTIEPSTTRTAGCPSRAPASRQRSPAAAAFTASSTARARRCSISSARPGRSRSGASRAWSIA